MDGESSIQSSFDLCIRFECCDTTHLICPISKSIAHLQSIIHYSFYYLCFNTLVLIYPPTSCLGKNRLQLH